MKVTYFIFTLGLLGLLSCQSGGEDSDAYGNFEARTITVSSEANGRLLRLEVEEGQRVRAGELMGIVDTTQLHLQRKQIQASINTLPKKLRNALSEIEVLKEQKSNLIRERERLKRLVEKEAAPQKSLDDLDGEIDVLDQRMEAIRSQTQTANQGILAEKEPLLAQIAVIEEQIRKSYIFNPVEGQVLTKLSEPHEVVMMGSPLYRIGQMDTLKLRFYLSSLQLQEARLGQKIQVLVDQGREDYRLLDGRISWISEEAEFTPKTIQTKEDRVNLVYAVKALVPNEGGKVKIGMPAEVKFKEESSTLSQK